jgi:hypothetical protein
MLSPICQPLIFTAESPSSPEILESGDFCAPGGFVIKIPFIPVYRWQARNERGLGRDEAKQILDGFVAFDLGLEGFDAVFPELLGADVDAEAFGQFGGGGFAGAGEQVHVVGHKGCAALLVDGVQAGGKEQAKGVGEVVEREFGRVVVRFPGPHPFLQVDFRRGRRRRAFALGAFHDLAQFIGAQFGFFAALEDFFLEQEARVDIDDDLAGAVQREFEHGQFFLRVGGALEQGLRCDGFTHDRGGFGQGHGGILLQHGFAEAEGAFVVEGVAEFVGDG